MKKATFLLGLIILVSCGDNNATAVYQEINPVINFEKPINFPEPKQQVGKGTFTQKGFELGRKLFYDGRLSKDNSVSCAFCHEQEHAFTHHGHQFSHGINGLEGKRNTPAIQNLAFLDDFFHDGAVPILNKIAIAPMTNPVEMDETPENVAQKLKSDPVYVRLFKEAFPDGKVSSYNMLDALAQFLGMMVSSNSKYDQYIRKEKGVVFTSQEKQGLSVFKTKCASCHATDLFTDHTFRNNGLAPNPKIDDKGREDVTGYAENRYKFKVPSLRNVEKTAPYMHDGRFGSLESVLHFYSTQIHGSVTLDPLLKKDNQIGISLTEEEKKVLIAFLKTLTDYEFLNDPRFYEKT